ncbi:hypothetical protein Tco_0421506, partial [Tanacetum coccineum]
MLTNKGWVDGNGSNPGGGFGKSGGGHETSGGGDGLDGPDGQLSMLVKDSKRRAFWSLNEDILKITILKTNQERYGVSVPALTKRPQKNKDQYA